MQCLDSFLDFQGIAHGIAQRLIHVGNHGGNLPAHALADLDHQARKLFGLRFRFHERTAPHFDIQHDGICTRCDFLAHDASCDQRHAGNGGGHVAQGVELAVGRGQIGALSRHHDAMFRQHCQELLGAETDTEAPDRFQLIDSPAREA